jgi:hypothetical protein
LLNWCGGTLAALKEADSAMYDAVAARVKEIDPLFR